MEHQQNVPETPEPQSPACRDDVDGAIADADDARFKTPARPITMPLHHLRAPEKKGRGARFAGIVTPLAVQAPAHLHQQSVHSAAQLPPTIGFLSPRGSVHEQKHM